MRIAKSALVDPRHNEIYAVAAVALSFFVFAYSTRFGQVSILAYYGVWLPLVLVDYRRVLGNYTRYGWIFAFALFCFLSAFWSAAPATSLRTAVQYLTHVVCALIAMRVLTASTLSKGAVAGSALVLVYSLAFGGYHYDPLDGSYSFVGAFASKNQLGLYASLGVLFSYACLLIFRTRPAWSIVCVATGILALYCLLASQSATSVITTAAILCLCLAMQAVSLLAPQQRKLLFAAGAILAVGIAVAALQFGAIDALLGIFGKDSTLTGRTYLWQQGILAAGEAPWLGVGYQGYWVQGFPEPERLWEEFFIASRSGFHFHNTYIETMVETGLVGTLLLAGVLLATFTGHLRHTLTRDRSPASLTLFAVAALLLFRSFVEIDIMHPYHVGSFLFYFAAGKLTLASPEHGRAREDHAVASFNPAHPG